MGAGIKFAYDAGVLKTEAELNDLNTGRKSVKESIESREYLRQIRNEWTTEARSNALRSAIISACTSMPSMPQLVSEWHTGINKRKIVVTLADAHYGAEWEIKGLHGETINKYSPEVFAERMTNLFSGLVRVINREEVYDIVICMLGDSLDGMLRQSQLMRLRYGMIESCMRYSEYLAYWVNSLSENCNSIEIYNVDGNHTEVRPLGSKRNDFPEENLERIITWYLEERLKSNEKIYVDVDFAKKKLIDVCGQSILISHGDDDAELTAAARDSMLLYNAPIDMMITAHKHNRSMSLLGSTRDGNTEIIRSPSICGIDSFADKLKVGGKPGACLFVVEECKGRIVDYPITL